MTEPPDLDATPGLDDPALAAAGPGTIAGQGAAAADLALSAGSAGGEAVTPEELEKVLELAKLSLSRFGDDPPLEAEGRVAAAAALAEQGENLAALHLLQEALVLLRTMAELQHQGRQYDPLDMKIQSHLARHLQGLLGGDELEQQIEERAQDAALKLLMGPELKGAMEGLLQRHLELHLQEKAFQQAVAGLIEQALRAQLADEAFAAAAAQAAAERPQDLLDRPETLARIESVAVEQSRALLRSSLFASRVSQLVRDEGESLAADPHLEAALETLTRERLESFLSDPAHEGLLRLEGQPGPAAGGGETSDGALSPAQTERVQALIDETVSGPRLAEEIDRRRRDMIESSYFHGRLEAIVRDSPKLGVALSENPEFRLALSELTDASLERGRARFEERADEIARHRCEALVEATGFRKVVEELARKASHDLTDKAVRDSEARLRTEIEEAGDDLLTSSAFKSLVEDSAARLLKSGGTRLMVEKMIEDRFARREEDATALETRLEDLMEERLERALSSAGEEILESPALEDKVGAALARQLKSGGTKLALEKMIDDHVKKHVDGLVRSQALGQVIDDRLEKFKQREIAAQRQRKKQ